MIENYLFRYGFKEEMVEVIINDPSLEGTFEEILLNNICENIKYLEVFGFSRTKIIEIVGRNPAILGLKTRELKRKMDIFFDLGFDMREILSLVRNLPRLMTTNLEVLEEKFSALERYGFKRDKLMSMARRFPEFLTITSIALFSKLEMLENFGFTKEETITIVEKFPQILTISSVALGEKQEFLKDKGFTKEEIKAIAIASPGILRYKCEVFEEKIEYILELGFKDYFLAHPDCLTQSVELTKARYKYLLSIRNGRDVLSGRTLFMNSSRFEDIFGISKNELLKKYRYITAKEH